MHIFLPDFLVLELIDHILLTIFQILKGAPDRTELVTVKPRDIRRKVFDKKVSAQDRDMNVVSMKDIVRVLDGHYKVNHELFE